MYESNYQTLARICAEKSVIRHVSQHRKADGSLDIEGNLKIWNNAIAQFDQIPLWKDGAPNYDGRDPLQPQPSIIFVPAQNGGGRRGTVMWPMAADLSPGPAARACTPQNGFATPGLTPPF